MAFFKNNYNKPGPGVPKNAPKKKGLGRFIEILGRDTGNLFKLNVIYQLYILASQALFLVAVNLFFGGYILWAGIAGILALAASIVTGPATTALFYCLTKMLRDDPGFVWHDFKENFRKNFRSSLVPGLVFSFLIGMQYLAYLLYSSMAAQTNIVVLALFFLSILLLSLIFPYYFAQAPYLDLPPSAILKNSLLLALGVLPRSFGAFILGIVPLVAQWVLFPVLLPVTILIGYSLPMLVALMWVWPTVDKTFKINETLVKRATESEEETEAEATVEE